MDELMKKALEKHKIVRYVPTFLEVMTTYKKLLDSQNEALNKHDVIGQSEQLTQTCELCGIPKHTVLGVSCLSNECPGKR